MPAIWVSGIRPQNRCGMLEAGYKRTLMGMKPTEAVAKLIVDAGANVQGQPCPLRPGTRPTACLETHDGYSYEQASATKKRGARPSFVAP